MTQSEYVHEVQKELLAEGFTIIRKASRQRFFAADQAGLRYEIRIKYCIKPRKLEVPDIGPMTGLMADDAIKILITNGTSMTKFVTDWMKEKDIKVILNWNPGTKIQEQFT